MSKIRSFKGEDSKAQAIVNVIKENGDYAISYDIVEFPEGLEIEDLYAMILGLKGFIFSLEQMVEKLENE